MEDRREGSFEAKKLTTRLLNSGYAGAFIHYIVHVSDLDSITSNIPSLGVVD